MNNQAIKRFGTLALLFSVTNTAGVEASRAEAMAAVNAQVDALSQAVSEAMEGSMSEAEIRESISEHLASYLESSQGEQMEVRPTERDFVQLEVSTQSNKIRLHRPSLVVENASNNLSLKHSS